MDELSKAVGKKTKEISTLKNDNNNLQAKDKIKSEANSELNLESESISAIEVTIDPLKD